ncbi:hypothetical protein [Alkalihalobacillus sp. AL-G]|uniref:hypothetical protein n=1 Tax=Alkalihalobacillus sp. AL-G TaxID=2926399 RepID=UPI0027299A45|nr:hypothetical protein [Alkalihalobacillus sp. AL-G]WLD93427.1 hypothetical protein MOJ78_00195 [Alkalihalobacillus sp. AL-G]
MDDKLKNLDKVMEKAVYQKKRFSEESKTTVMNRIREQKKPSRFEKYARVMKPVLSLTVCLFLLVFSVSFILQPPKDQQETVKSADTKTPEGAVTSLPLLNRLSHIAQRDNQMIRRVSASKNDHYVHLSIHVTPNSSESQIRTAIEELFLRGSELYLDKEMDVLSAIGAPWENYTVDITVVENTDRKGIWQEQASFILQGIKPNNQDFITWLNEEKK